VADKVGSLAPGLCADLLVIQGTPLELRSEVKHVFLNGRDLPLTSRQTRLYDRYNARPRAGAK
jgi:imidazolonepropionase-like amidohydrolase